MKDLDRNPAPTSATGAPGATGPGVTAGGAWKARLARWSPSLLGLALALGGLGALGVASSQVRVTVVPAGGPATEADPLALLRDDVGALQRDLGQLDEGLGRNLEALAAAVDAGAGAHADRLAGRLEGRLAALERRLGELAADVATARADRGPSAPPPSSADRAADGAGPGPAQAGAGAPGQDPGGTAPAAPGAVAAAADAGPTAPVAAPPEAAGLGAAEAPGTGAPAGRPGLFSFRSASGLDWDERLRFQVLPSLSRVGFDAKSTLHDFTGVTSEVEGRLALRLADPGHDGEGEVVARAATLKTGIDGRDEELRKRLETARHPELRFVLRVFRGASVDRAARRVTGQVEGDMTIHGVTRRLTVPVELTVDDARRLVVTGDAALRMSDFQVEPPTVGPISVEDQVRFWVALRLRSLGPAGAVAAGEGAR